MRIDIGRKPCIIFLALRMCDPGGGFIIALLIVRRGREVERLTHLSDFTGLQLDGIRRGRIEIDHDGGITVRNLGLPAPGVAQQHHATIGLAFKAQRAAIPLGDMRPDAPCRINFGIRYPSRLLGRGAKIETDTEAERFDIENHDLAVFRVGGGLAKRRDLKFVRFADTFPR